MKKITIFATLVVLLLGGCLEIVEDDSDLNVDLAMTKQDVFLSSDEQTAYVNVGSAGIDFINVSNTNSPSLINRYDLNEHVYGMALSGTTLFVANSLNGLQILDVSNVNNINKISYFHTGDDNATAIAISHDLTKVAIGTQLGVQLVDITNDSLPKYLGDYDSNGTIMDIQFSANDNLLYLANMSYGLEVIDISSPSHPDILDGIALEGTPTDIVLDRTGASAFVSTLSSAVKRVDISDSYDLEIEDIYDTHDGSLAWAIYQTSNWQRLYISKGNKGFEIVNISTLSDQRQVGTYDTNGTVHGMTVNSDQSKAYISDGEEGFKIFDISDKTNPVREGILLY